MAPVRKLQAAVPDKGPVLGKILFRQDAAVVTNVRDDRLGYLASVVGVRAVAADGVEHVREVGLFQ